MFFDRLLKTPETSVLNRVPEQCVECLSADVMRMHLTRLDKEGNIQRRYQCRACDHNLLVKHCESLDDLKEYDNISGPSDTEAAISETSEYEKKIASLENQLALIDQEIANSQQIAEKQESELMRAKLGIGDLRNLEAVTAKHTRLLTLLNELHRMQYSKALVLAETEHEKDQLTSHLESIQASSAEMESHLRSELENAREDQQAILRENQGLKERVLSLEGELRGVTKALMEMQTVRNLEAQLSAETHIRASHSHESSDQGKEVKASSHFIDTNSANTELLERPEELSIDKEPALDQQPTGHHALASKKYRLGIKYIKGDGVKQSERKAIALFEHAAKLGNASAQYNLGVLQYKGSQSVRDLKASVYWLLQAASQNHEKAASLLPEVEAAFSMYDQQNIAV
ncbi:MAG: hypothetical protein AAF542_00145 [Pseudomonadota bacterium]